MAWRYDVYRGAGRGRGWLGYPVAPPTPHPGGAWSREFENGLAIANPTDGVVRVHVPEGFEKLAGTDAPDNDDGSVVSGELLVPGKDGYLLVRAARAGPGRP